MTGTDRQNGIVLFGGGGHALVVADAADAAGLGIAGFFDDDPRAPLSTRAACLGALGDGLGSSHRGWIVAIGNLDLRIRVIETLRAHEHDAAAVVHPSAIVSPSASIGRGAFIGPGAIINARAEIDEHAIINSGAVIEHDCVIGVNAHIAPRAALGGGARVGANTLVGIGSCALPGIVIGSGATIGAGAAVIENVNDGQRVAGTPARPID